MSDERCPACGGPTRYQSGAPGWCDRCHPILDSHRDEARRVIPEMRAAFRDEAGSYDVVNIGMAAFVTGLRVGLIDRALAAAAIDEASAVPGCLPYLIEESDAFAMVHHLPDGREVTALVCLHCSYKEVPGFAFMDHDCDAWMAASDEARAENEAAHFEDLRRRLVEAGMKEDPT